MSSPNTLTLHHASLVNLTGRGYYQRLSDGSLLPTSIKQGQAIALAGGLELVVLKAEKKEYRPRGRRVNRATIDRGTEMLDGLPLKNPRP